MHLGEPRPNAREHRPDGDGGPQDAAAGGGGALELIVDDAVHLLGLRVQPLRVAPFPQGAAEHGQRRLQAVGEIGQGIAIAAALLALGADEGIEPFRESREFRRPAAGERLPAPGADIIEFCRQATQRRKPPGEHRPLGGHQQQGRKPQAGHQAAAEGHERLAVSSGRFGDAHPQMQDGAGAILPGDALGQQKHPLVARWPETPFPLAHRWRRKGPFEERGRAPEDAAFRGLHLGITAGVGTGQGFVGQPLRHLQPSVGIHLEGGQQPVQARLQPGLHDLACALVPGAFQRQAGEPQEQGHHQQAREPQPGAQGVHLRTSSPAGARR